MPKKKVTVMIKVILIIALFTCIHYTNGSYRKVTLLEDIFSDFVTLPERVIVYARHFFGEDKNQFFKDVEKLKEENQALKEKVGELENKMMDYELVVSENDVLKKHENLKESYPNYEVVIADIILSSDNHWSNVFVINQGEKSGIKAGSAVICKDGLVGYVESVSSNSAKVVSILDAGNAVSARITRTRDTVVTKGNLSLISKNQMKVTNIPVGVTLIEGDKIETSGLGGIYPKGIVIGKITSFEQKNNPIENEAVVESQVNFDKLETVAVIMSE